VILAAVIAAFVLGLGDTSNPAPQVSFDYDYDSTDEILEITVSSGDRVESDRLTFEGNDFSGGTWTSNRVSNSGTNTVLSAGDTAELNSVTPDFELDIVFTSEDGQDSSIISTRTGPDAN
jgi:FlaG/FlaF family flagellin (archaellin)